MFKKLLPFAIIGVAFATSINLQKGWNLVGTDKEITSFSHILKEGSYIFSFDNKTKKWRFLSNKVKTYLPKIESIKSGEGFWVFSGKTANIELNISKIGEKIELQKGWQILSPVLDINSSQLEGTIFWKFDNKTKKWLVYSSDKNIESKIVKFEKIKTIKKGEGYWFYNGSTKYDYIPKEINRSIAIRFLNKATFGADEKSIKELQTKGVVNWLNEQLNKPLTKNLYLTKTIEMAKELEPKEYNNSVEEYLKDNEIVFNKNVASFMINRYRMSSWFDVALKSDDQLRQKTAYVLSQIVVESSDESGFHRRDEAIARYFDILQENAFKKYSDLLYNISISSSMGIYLTYNGNKKKYKNKAGVEVYPDENYGREVMQLFSIGLYQLNMDGTPKKDENGSLIPTYTQTDVNELSRVFTGWDLKRYEKKGKDKDKYFGRTGIKLGDYTHPMEFTSKFHDFGEKTVLGKKISANLTGEQDIKEAVKILASNPNTPPFIAKHLIMRFIKSNPSPNYIKRVATIFKNSGGDLKQAIKAIFLDPEFWNDLKTGKIEKFKEPLIAYTGFLKSLNVKPLPYWYFCKNYKPVDENGSNCLKVTNKFLFNFPDQYLGEGAGLSPTVFNFYDNGFIPNDKNFKTKNIVAPELQIQNDEILIQFSNRIIYNLRYWDKNYILNVSHKNKKDGSYKFYNSLNEYIDDYAKMGDYHIYYIWIDKMLLNTDDILNVMEKIVDGDTDGDFKNIVDYRGKDGNYSVVQKGLKGVIEYVDYKLTGGVLTKKEKESIYDSLKEKIYNKYSNKDGSVKGKIKQILRNVIYPTIRAIITSNKYMTE